MCYLGSCAHEAMKAGGARDTDVARRRNGDGIYFFSSACSKGDAVAGIGGRSRAGAFVPVAWERLARDERVTFREMHTQVFKASAWCHELTHNKEGARLTATMNEDVLRQISRSIRQHVPSPSAPDGPELDSQIT